MSHRRFHAVVPAAGTGERMRAERPKQYLELGGATVIEHALAPLLTHPGLGRLVVVLAADDRMFATLPVIADDRLLTASGGATRARSVAAGLQALIDAGVDGAATVLVHDAARPCLWSTDVERLLVASDNGEGAVLATPVADTLKREGSPGRVDATVDRTGLWRALTPQAFPLAPLLSALAGDGHDCTDESQAMERAGYRPMLVEADGHNPKITHAADLDLAEVILARRKEPA